MKDGFMLLVDVPKYHQFITLLNERLPEKTIRHSISVAETLMSITDELELSHVSAATAGLLHDLAKGWDNDRMLFEASRRNIKPTRTQKIKPKLLHGPLAADICRRELALSDTEVLEAIHWHTTGYPGFCRLGIALYYADFAEPLREYPEAPRARLMFQQQGLLPAVQFVAATKMEYAWRKPPLDPNTEAFARWLVDFQEEAAGYGHATG